MSQLTKKSFHLCGVLYLLLVACRCTADSEVNKTLIVDAKEAAASLDGNYANEKTGRASGGTVDLVQNELEKSNVSQPVGKEGHDEKNVNGALKDKGSGKEAVEEGKQDSSGSLMPQEKEKSQVGECDSSNMCFDEKNNLVACLRVPGNESPDLSLLIQNKGKRALDVVITAPEFVQLEKTKVQVQPKEDKKVKVSVGYDGIDSLIILTTEDGRCSLDFRDFISQNSRTDIHSAYKFSYLDSLTRIHYAIFISATAFLILASVSICIGYRRKYFFRHRYQTVDAELAVSGENKVGSDANSGWENNWDDNWEDEEAPKTPDMPTTPSLSSRGLASRRLTKEGWKN